MYKMADGENSDCSAELELSCDSSDFEDHVDEEEAETAQGTFPYCFEPEYAESGANTDDSSSQQSQQLAELRLSSTDWCQCGNCALMGTPKECICCAEIPEMMARTQAVEVQCITDHPGFQSVCLDKYVLEVSYAWYNQQYGQHIADENNRYRYTAYRQLARFAWTWLGKDIRVVLPACAVKRIREEFPSEDGVYTGYLEPDH